MTFSRKRSVSLFSISAIAALALFAATPAFAHAALRNAVPAAGAVVAQPPTKLSLEFSCAIDLTDVELSVVGPAGQEVALSPPEGEAKSGTTIERTAAAALAPGRYKVAWRVLSVDGHHTRGTYTFDVK
jgi:methionine-rich copper-binding protein CopC